MKKFIHRKNVKNPKIVFALGQNIVHTMGQNKSTLAAYEGRGFTYLSLPKSHSMAAVEAYKTTFI